MDFLRQKYSDNVHPANLPQFITNTRTEGPDLVLPEELLNEPWTFDDTGLRLELKSRRPKFLFKIDEEGVASCIVGTSYIGDQDLGGLPDNFDGARMKRTSNISVLSVYSNYGLDITYEYLWYLYHNKHPRLAVAWLTTYLASSLDEILGPERALSFRHKLSDTSPYHAIYLCSEIMRLLEQRDNREPKLVSDLTDVPEGTLPADLLARVIGSARISKELALETH